jgi:hypothetical protein
MRTAAWSFFHSLGIRLFSSGDMSFPTSFSILHRPLSPELLAIALLALSAIITMSVTTTQNVVTRQTLQVLGDYELHHSESQDSTSTTSSPPLPQNDTSREEKETANTNLPDWPQGHRRIPPHRPIDRNLDFEQRPAGLNGPEYVFIQTMLQGVRLNAVSDLLERRCGIEANEL